MGYTIIDSRTFIKTTRGIIPLALGGSNNCTEVIYDKNSKRREVRERHWFIKGGIRKRNQAPYEVFGFRLWDKVLFNGQECFISARRTSGYFALKDFDGKKVHASASHKVLTIVEAATSYLIERRTAVSSRG